METYGREKWKPQISRIQPDMSNLTLTYPIYFALNDQGVAQNVQSYCLTFGTEHKLPTHCAHTTETGILDRLQVTYCVQIFVEAVALNGWESTNKCRDMHKNKAFDSENAVKMHAQCTPQLQNIGES